MKRDIETQSLFSNTKETATIIIDKNGMRIENKNPSYQSDYDIISDFLRRCIDIDTWKHSWHLNVRRASIKRSTERKKIKQILNEKIKQREDEIKLFKDARHILSKW
jgi:hypothetical protein